MNSSTKWDQFNDWNPVRELEEFQNQLESGFYGSRMRSGENLAPTEWAPPVDILEDDDEFLIKADLPEVSRENVQVTVENRVLSIRGERHVDCEAKRMRYHRSERSYGTFRRSFSLPDAADASNIHAEFKDGLLKVHIGKAKRTGTKQVGVAIE